MATLTVLMGCPGSGKTTWMQAHQAGHVLCSTERLRTDPALRGQAAMIAFLRALQSKAERALQAGQDAIMDGCNVRAHERSRWLTLARRHHASTHLVVMHAPTATLLDVQRTRTHGVPEARMLTYVRDFDRALTRIEHEGWTRITHVRRGGGSEYIEPQPKRVSSW